MIMTTMGSQYWPQTIEGRAAVPIVDRRRSNTKGAAAIRKRIEATVLRRAPQVMVKVSYCMMQ